MERRFPPHAANFLSPTPLATRSGLFTSSKMSALEKLADRSSQIAIGVVTVGVLTLASAYAGFAKPILDDWCFAVNPLAPIERANDLYMTWTGRWPTMALLSAMLRGQDVGSSDYVAFAAVGLPIWFMAFLVIADRAMGPGLWTRKISAAAVMLATFWSTTFGTGETFYWVAGYIGYALPFLLGALCLSISTSMLNPVRLTLACAVGFLSAAMNELGGIVLIVSLGAVALHRLLDRQSIVPTLLVAFAVATGAAFVILSPGNAVRALDQQTMSLPKIIWTIIRPYESPLSIIADPRALALAAAVVALPNANRSVPERWWFVPATAVAASYIAVLAVAVATGTAPGYRILSFLQAGVLGAFFVAAWQLRGLPLPRTATHFCFAALLATAPVVGAALHDLPMALHEWNPAHRWDHLKKKAGRDVVLLDYANYPSIYPDREISTDPTFFSNRCIATHFGLRSIRTVGPDGARWRR